MKGPLRRLAGLAAVAACALLCAPSGAAAAEALPDLVADPPVDKGLSIVDGRLVLRFDGYVRNAGLGAVELLGAPDNGVLTNVRQQTYDEDGTTPAREIPSPAVIRYENHVDHSHFHLQSAARYSLWTEDRLWEVIGSEKAGFCLTDSFHAEPGKGPAVRAYNGSGCASGNPSAAEVLMGISGGWRDDYPSFLAYQWLNVSGLRPGRYRLGADVDPDDFVVEADEANPVAFQDEPAVVPGYVARAQDLGEVNPFLPVELTLDADRYERPAGPALGPAAFAVTSQPSCGSLSGEAPLLTYTPGSDCNGAIGFEFEARDSTSSFPTSAPTAAVSLRLSTRRALSKPKAVRKGRKLRVRMRSLYAGELRAAAWRRGRRRGRCSTDAQAGLRATCAIRLRRGEPRRGLRLRTSLLIGGRVVATRRDKLN